MTPRLIQTGNILVVDDVTSIHDAFDAILVPQTDLPSSVAPISLDGPACIADKSKAKPVFRLTHAYSGDDGILEVSSAADKNQNFDMAFVDLRMPGIDGVEAIERMWQIEPDLQVVICTGCDEYNWEEVTRRLGVSDSLLMLKKPFTPEVVNQFATALVQKRQVLVENRKQLNALESTNRQLLAEVGQRRTAEHRLEHAASHDSLTGLPNRDYIRKAIAAQIAERSREERPRIERPCGEQGALLFLDLDNFKFINDSLGHSVGDEMLIQLSRRMESICQQAERDYSLKSTVARLGGDEFVILLDDLNDPQDAVHLATLLKDGLVRQYALKGHDVAMGVSIGVAYFPESIERPEQLMKNADLAMYRAKFSGKQCIAVFDEAMHQVATRRLGLEGALREAVGNNEFSLRFQPIVKVGNGMLVGFESLLRWRRSDGTEVGPDEFIPLAEETGLIRSIGQWVLENACRTIARVNRDRLNSQLLTISVNVSQRQVVDPAFADEVAEILQRHGVDGNSLILEITESVVMDSPETVVDRLLELKRLGIRLYMDDFGTGHSSLSCLHRYPIDALKIDHSLVSTIESKADFESIVHAIITLAHNLNSSVVAEGIETAAELECLDDLNCDFGQGYFFSKPVPESQIDELIVRLSGETSPSSL